MFKEEKYVGCAIKLGNKKIKLTGYIGSGGNSVVYRCKYSEKDFVIKFFKGYKKRYMRFKEEIEKIKYLNSRIEDFTPAVIETSLTKYNSKTFPYFKIDTAPFYIMEMGDRYQYDSLTFEQKLDDMIEICNSLKKMHDLNIQHRDIKPENILKYNGRLTYIDYGTACMPGFETIDGQEAMGSKGTMAPEMVNQAYGISGYKFEYADIYSLGKTLWILLTNDRNAHKFTTYEPTNVSSKIKIERVHNGIVMALERIIMGATRENYLERISLDKIIESLIMIRDGLLGNDENCNIMKFKCLLENVVNPKYDMILIGEESKKLDFIKNISNLGIYLSLEESEKKLCDSAKMSSFSIEYELSEYYYFILNDTKFLFKIEDLLIDSKRICIKTTKLDNLILGEDSKCFIDIDSFSKRSILTNPIDSITKNIYLECDICLNIIS